MHLPRPNDSRREGATGAIASTRILHVFEMGVIGGQFRVVEGLAAAQKKAGHEPVVAAVIAGEEARRHPLLESIRDHDVPVVEIVLPGPRSYLTERREVVREARRRKADVVHTHGYRADVVDAPAARRAGIPTVCTLHGFIGGGRRNRLYEALQRRTARRLDAAVVVSEEMKQALVADGFPPARLHVVPNRWSATTELLPREAARSQLGLPDNAFAIGWVGRVSREKGLDVALEALRLLDHRDVELSVIGDGPERQPQEASSQDLPIRWHGVVHGADRLFGAFDLFLLSSRTEGTPIVLFEAMRAAVPVVATRVGGVPDVVGQSEAILVEPEDPAALAAAIRKVRRNPKEAVRRAEAAADRLRDRYSAEEWVESYQRVYQAAVEAHEHSRR